MLWNNPNCPNKFKILVFDAAIRSKLVYGLESLELSSGLLNHVNAFQLKGLRRILGLKTTYVDRNNSNKKVFEEANNIANPKNKQDKNVKTFSQYIHKQQHKLLAHTIRADATDPLRQCIFSENTDLPYEHDKRRVGRPRNNWTNEVYKRLVRVNLPYSIEELKKNPKPYFVKIASKAKDRSLTT